MPIQVDPVTTEELNLLERWIDEMPATDPGKALDSARKRLSLAEKHLSALRFAKSSPAAAVP